ncbi:MAG: CHASE domain-containing protein [Rubrivivax sp.]|nr:CHASE domain-containing protein [Rubrivivax sp.]
MTPRIPGLPPSPLVVALGTAAGYALVGWVALMLAGPPGYASPLYPSAGIALAATLTWGRAALPGVWLGAFAVNAALGALRGQAGTALLWLPLLIGLGAMLQAALGALLVRRFVGQPVVLNAPRDILLSGLLGAGLACTVSPSIATAALLSTGAVLREGALANWLTWWIGDTLGVLIGAPLVLTLIGRPREDWRPRRRTLGLPLLLALALLAAAMVELGRLDRQRVQATFERDADRLVSEAHERLRTPLHALQALHGAALARDGTLDARALRNASAAWLAAPSHLQAAGYSVRVAEPDIDAFVAAARAGGDDADAAFRVFDRDDGSARRGDGEVVAIRHIEPRAGNASALGVNALSIPAARAAILAARDSGAPAATAGFRLTQTDEDETGLVIYRALYRGAVADDVQARRERFAGVVFVTVRIERAWADLAPATLPYLRWCVVDLAPDSVRPRLAGPPGCEAPGRTANAAAGLLHTERTFELGGRRVELRIAGDPAAMPGEAREAAWLLSLAGLSAAAMLGALLLTVTGATRRTELAVQAGTADLRREIAEREQVQAALARSEERLRSIVDNVPVGVAFIDPLGTLVQANRGLAAMLDEPDGALHGRRIVDMTHPEDRELVLRDHRALLTGGIDLARLQMRLLRRDGSPLDVRVVANAMRGAEGRVTHMIALVEDITEHLRLEASERALQQAEAASRAKSEFVSRMSHELRTPLNAMIGFAQLLGLDREPALVPHQRDWTQQIQRAGWHLLELINETLDLARIESGAVQLKPEAVELVPLVAACQSLIAGPAAERGVSLVVQCDPAVPAVLADPTRLKQVLTNLLSNAVKYNRSGGTVRLATAPAADGGVAISVRDTGLGMTREQLGALFQPYNRLGREGSGIEGTGIGLVISRRLTELMGGTLEVASTAGEGSVFTVRLPAAVGEVTRPAVFTESSPAPYQQRMVHYIEDNPTNVEVMRGVLAQRSQVVLQVSTLGLDGLAAVRRQRPDLILLDMQLPDISGIELLRHLKDDLELADIPVVVVSADATPGHMQKALTLGALHYVTKPLDVARFLAVVDEVLLGVETRWGL